jgi:outer membrane cobalamin receptor
MFRRRACCAGCLLLAAAAAWTQQRTEVELEEVVVTGSLAAAGLPALEAGYSVTTRSDSYIADYAPSSAADLLNAVPGVWAETSGGETGANIEVAGFPSGSDAPYVTMSLNGSPLYAAPTLSFLENSTLMRLDDTVERMEVVQGGPALVLSSGQIGATANLILREGGSVPHGTAAVTVGAEGMYRVDGFYGTSIARGWRVGAGGFYRITDGIRSPQYPADKGGQFTMTLARNWDRGKVLFYVRRLDDRNLFTTGVPVVASADGRDVSAFPGFDPRNDTFAGRALRRLRLEQFPGSPPGVLQPDLAEGRGARVFVLGSNVETAIGHALRISNDLGYTHGRAPVVALFNNITPTTLEQFIAEQVATANADAAVVEAAGRPATGGTASWGDGGAVDTATPVASLGLWVVDKQIRSFTDELRLSVRTAEHNDVIVGAYLASYGSRDTWYLGNNLLIDVAPNARPIGLTLDNGVQVAKGGVLSGSLYTFNGSFGARNTAIFVADRWNGTHWHLDAGLRLERQRLEGYVRGNATADLDTDPLTSYNNRVSVAGDSWTRHDHTRTSHAWTIGALRDLGPLWSAYARASEGFHLPSFDDVRNGYEDAQRVRSIEVGARGRTGTLRASLELFRRRFTGVAYNQFLSDGSQVTGLYGAESVGFGADLQWQLSSLLGVDATISWQDSTYTNYYSARVGTNEAYDYGGNRLQRQPGIRYRIAPNANWRRHWGALRVFIAGEYVGFRHSDPANTQPLPAYFTLDAGVVAQWSSGLEVRLQGGNLTNRIGLTEGNPRVLDSGIVEGLEMVRSIAGRQVSLALRYRL